MKITLSKPLRQRKIFLIYSVLDGNDWTFKITYQNCIAFFLRSTQHNRMILGHPYGSKYDTVSSVEKLFMLIKFYAENWNHIALWNCTNEIFKNENSSCSCPLTGLLVIQTAKQKQTQFASCDISVAVFDFPQDFHYKVYFRSRGKHKHNFS